MPTYQQGMTYTNEGGAQIPIVSQADLDNLASAGFSPNPIAAPITPTQTPQQEAESMLSGMTSPMTLDQIRTREAGEREARRNSANALFDPTISRERIKGAGQVSSAEGVTGQAQGFNISTAETQYINNVQNQVADRISEIEKSKADWIATGDFEAAKRADTAIAQLSEYQNNLIIKKAELALSIGASRRSDAELDINTISALSKIPAGQSVTIGGKTYTGTATPDPFFSGSDITQLMKELPIGKTQTITDPSTGTTYTIKGIASSDPSIKMIESYDNAGNLTITSYKTDPMTGKVSVMNQVNGGRVGKVNVSGGGDGTDKDTEAFLKDVKDVVSKMASGTDGWDWKAGYEYIKTVYAPQNPDLVAPLTPEEIQALGGNPALDQNRLDIFLNKSQFYED